MSKLERERERERERGGVKKHAKARAGVDEISKHTTAKYDPSSFESLQQQPASQPASQQLSEIECSYQKPISTYHLLHEGVFFFFSP
jgi:hypothetical protein